MIPNHIEDSAQTIVRKEPGLLGSRRPSTQPKKNTGPSGSGETSKTPD